MPPGHQGKRQSKRSRPWIKAVGHRSARVPGWLVGRLRLGVGHAGGDLVAVADLDMAVLGHRSHRASWQVVRYKQTGLKGGKGVPETVASHPRLFVTFTAPASAGSTRARPKGGWSCPAIRTARVPAARTASGLAAGIAMTWMTLGWGSHCVRPATTPRRRCSGTPWPRSCGGGPPSPSSVPWAAWSAWTRPGCVGWSGSPMPRWPSTNVGARSTSMRSSAWTRPPSAAAPAAWPRHPSRSRPPCSRRRYSRRSRLSGCPARLWKMAGRAAMPAGVSSSMCTTSRPATTRRGS
jgi:hypothetical protein